MYRCLSPWALGMAVKNLHEALEIASKTGYDGLEFSIQEVADLIDKDGSNAVRKMFCEAHLWPAGWGLPVDWRGPEERWREGLRALPRFASASQQLGCSRTSTWITPGSNDRTLEENRAFHIQRFKPISEILAEHDCRLGLEFVGPKTSRDAFKYPFIYTLDAMMDMAREIGPNVGLLLDCWHWHTSGGSVKDILKLQPKDIVYVHVSDAPAGVSMDEYLDHRRCLPGATGVIDLPGFLNALNTIGYDGPITPEPFGNPAVWALDGINTAWGKITR